jgi:hypothetical protein
MAFQPDFILNMPIIYMNITNKDLIIQTWKLRSTERKIKPKYIDPKRT